MKPDYSKLPKSWGVLGGPSGCPQVYNKTAEKLKPLLGDGFSYNTEKYYGITKSGSIDYAYSEQFDVTYTIQEFIALTEPEEEFVLPEKWVIQANDENREVLRQWYNTNPIAEEDGYTDHPSLRDSYVHSEKICSIGYRRTWSEPKKGFSIIHFDTFKQYVLKEEPVQVQPDFTLPEKWYIRVDEKTKPIVGKWIKLNRNTGNGINYENFPTNGFNYPATKSGNHTTDGDSRYIPTGYTEISFSQFQKYVLNQPKAKQPTVMTTKDTDLVVIPQELLQEGFKSGDLSNTMQAFIKDKMNIFTNEMEAQHIRTFYKTLVNSGCKWKKKLEDAFSFLKEPEQIDLSKKVDGKEPFLTVGDGDTALISVYKSDSKSFWLNNRYEWIVTKKSDGTVLLTPTRK